jgi:hypothetical protein
MQAAPGCGYRVCIPLPREAGKLGLVTRLLS